MGGDALERRMVRAAEAALAQRQYVSAVDVLVGLGWLAPSHVDRRPDPRPQDIALQCQRRARDRARLPHPLDLSGAFSRKAAPAGRHQASDLFAVVVRFSRNRKRYERQGLLVEAAALAQAEQRCPAPSSDGVS